MFSFFIRVAFCTKIVFQLCSPDFLYKNSFQLLFARRSIQNSFPTFVCQTICTFLKYIFFVQTVCTFFIVLFISPGCISKAVFFFCRNCLARICWKPFLHKFFFCTFCICFLYEKNQLKIPCRVFFRYFTI